MHEERSGGDAYRGDTRTHPEHDGKDLYGRWYYAGDGMGEQVAAGSLKKKNHSKECLYRTDMFQWAEIKARLVLKNVLTYFSRVVLFHITGFFPDTLQTFSLLR